MIETKESRLAWEKEHRAIQDQLRAALGSKRVVAAVVEEVRQQEVKPKFDKVAYQREYMRMKRAAEKIKKAQCQ